MSLSRLSCMTIQSNGDDVKAAAGKDAKTGKWAGWCNLWRGDVLSHHIFNTQPIFDSEVDAIAEVDKIVAHVRSLDGCVPVKKCHYCDATEDLRPYGPDGTDTCFPCGMAHEPETQRQFESQAKACGGTVLLTEDGPVPLKPPKEQH